MRALAFGAGLCCGGLVVLGVEAMAAGDPLPPPTASDAIAGGTPPSDELQQLRAELARLRADSAPGERRVADQPVTTADRGPAPSAPALAAADVLLRELQELIHNGILREQVATDPEALRDLLVQSWLANGTPLRALQLLQMVPEPMFDQDLLVHIANELTNRNDPDHAKEALLFGLRRNPTHWAAALQLADLDPAAGLQWQAEQLARPDLGIDPAQLEWHRAAFLIAAHRGSEVKDLLRKLASGGAANEEGEAAPNLDSLLAVRDPALALELFDERLAKDATNDTLQLHRATALQGTGRSKDAVQALLGVLDRNADHDEAWSRLEQLDRAEAVRRAVALAANHEPGPLLRAANLLHNAGRRDEAIANLEQVWAQDPNTAAWSMLRIDAPRFTNRIETYARQRRDDELLGEVGDHAFRSGRRAEAIRLWREAKAIDPGDGEWISKLRTAEAGGNPFE